MNGSLPYISLAEASKLSGYSAEYIRQLCVKGKIKGEKLGKSWVTTADEIQKFAQGNLAVPPTLAEIPHASFSFMPVAAKSALAVITLVVSLPVLGSLTGLDQRTGSLAHDVSEIIAVRKQDVESKYFKNFRDKLGDRFASFFDRGQDEDEGEIAGAITELRNDIISELDDLKNNFGSVAGTDTETNSRITDYGLLIKDEIQSAIRNSQSNNVSTPQVLGISNDEVIAAMRAVLSEGLPQDILSQLKGEKGDKGDVGIAVGYTLPTSPNPGSYGGFTFGSSKSFSAEDLTVTGTTTMSSLTLSKNLTVSGTTTLNGLTITNSTFTSTAQATFTKVPTLAHVFTPSWPSGTSNASDGTIYINPASSIADGNLISAAVGGTIKFLVDAEGDIYGNNLILTGSTSQGATTIAGNLTVQDSATFGDAGTDTVTFTAKVNSLIEFTGTNHAGIRLNNLTTAQRDALTPTAGYTIYNTTTGKMQVYTTSWKNVGNPEIGAEVTSGTSGSVLFVDSSGNLQQDNTNLNFNDTTNTLTVASIVNPMHIGGTGVSSTLTLKSTSGVGSSDAIIFQVGNNGGTEAMRIINSGNVGIGTTNPNVARLHVHAGGVADGGVFIKQTAADSIPVLYLVNDARQWELAVRGDSVGAFADELIISDGTGSTNPVRIQAGAATNSLVITTAGNIGIGTTTINSKVTISGSGQMMDFVGGGTTREYLIMSNTGGQGLFGIGGSTAGSIASGDLAYATVLGSNNATALQFGTNGAIRATIDSTGNVGIGTTGPSKLLHLLGSNVTTTGAGQLHVASNDAVAVDKGGQISFGGKVGGGDGTFGSVSGRSQNGATNDAGYLAFATANTSGVLAEKMRINQDGNVGIGTTGPESLLEIKASGTGADKLILFSEDNAGTNLFRLRHEWATSQFTPTITMVDGDGTNRVRLAGTSGGVNYINAGNVGIGTTGPSDPLEVSSVSGTTIRISAGPSGNNPNIEFWSSFNNAAERNWRIGTSEVEMGDLSITTSTAQGGDPDNATSRLYIKGNGNVGIGTTNPSSNTLQVTGSAGKTVGGTTWADLSDARLKNIQGELKGTALDTLMRLRPVSFKWNDTRKQLYGGSTDNLMYGFIAQEIKEVIPEFVKEGGDGYFWYNPSGFESILTAGVQELDARTTGIYEGSNLTTGDVVKFDLNGMVAKANDNDKAVGVVSSTTGLQPRVGYSGKMSVKATEENGSIQAGDRLTVSETLPGYAMKMTESGNSIGIALGNLENSPEGKGLIQAFINIAYQKIEVAQSSNGQLISLSNNLDAAGFSLLNVKAIASINGKWSIDENGLMIAVKVKADVLETKKGITVEDRATGAQFCIYVENGATLTTAGACDAVQSTAPASEGSVAGENTEIPVEDPVSETPPAEEPAEEPTTEEPVASETPSTP